MIDLFNTRFHKNRRKANDIIHSTICNSLKGLDFSITRTPVVPIMPSKNPDNSVTDIFEIVLIQKSKLSGMIQTLEVWTKIIIYANHKCYSGGFDEFDKGKVRWGFDTLAENMKVEGEGTGIAENMAYKINKAIAKKFPIDYTDLTDKEKDYALLWYEIEVKDRP